MAKLINNKKGEGDMIFSQIPQWVIWMLIVVVFLIIMGYIYIKSSELI